MIERIKLRLRKRVGAAAPPVKRCTYYYRSNSNELKTHLYIKGLLHDCDIGGCPSNNKS